MVNQFYDLFVMYGKHPGFTVKGKKLYITTLSYCTSFTALVFILLIIIFFTKELLIRMNPRIETIITNDLNPLTINVNDDNFVFLVGLLYPNFTGYVNEKIYNVEVDYVYQIKKKDGTVVNTKQGLEVTTCDKVYIPVLSSYFSSLALEQMYCLKNRSGIALDGDTGLQQFRFLDVKIKECVGNECYEKEKIDNILKGGYITLYTSDFNVFPSKYKESMQLYAKNIFSSISNKIYKEMWIYYKTIQFETDDGYFRHTNKTEYYFSFRDYTENFDFRDDTENTFLHIYLRSTRTRYTYSRAYEKIDTTITKIVCVCRLAYFLIKIISSKFESDLYNSYICSYYDADLRRQFQFSSSNNAASIKHKNSKKGLNDSSQHSCSNGENIENSNQNIYSSVSGMLNTNNQPQHHVKFKPLKQKNNNTSSNENSTFTNNNILGNHNSGKKYSYCLNSVKKSSCGLYTQISNQTHQCEKANSAQQKYSVSNTMKQKSPKTYDFNRPSDVKKLPENGNDDKVITPIKETEIEKAFKSIQNPNYKMKPFTCLQLVKYFVCHVDTVYEFKYIKKCYKNIGLYFDVIKYLKIFQEVEYVKEQMLHEKQIKNLQHNFSLEINPEYFVKQYYKTVLCSK